MSSHNNKSFFGNAHGRTGAPHSSSRDSRSSSHRSNTSSRNSQSSSYSTSTSNSRSATPTSRTTYANGRRVHILTPHESVRDMSDAELDREMRRIGGGSFGSRHSETWTNRPDVYISGSRSSHRDAMSSRTARISSSQRDNGRTHGFGNLVDEFERGRRDGGGSTRR